MKILKSNLFKYSFYCFILLFMMMKNNNYDDAEFVCKNYPDVVAFVFLTPIFIISFLLFFNELFLIIKSKLKSSDKKVN